LYCKECFELDYIIMWFFSCENGLFLRVWPFIVVRDTSYCSSICKNCFNLCNITFNWRRCELCGLFLSICLYVFSAKNKSELHSFSTWGPSIKDVRLKRGGGECANVDDLGWGGRKLPMANEKNEIKLCCVMQI